MLAFGGKIHSVFLLYNAVKGVVYGYCKHISAVDHIHLDGTLGRRKFADGVNSIFEKIADNYGNVGILYRQIVGYLYVPENAVSRSFAISA